VPPEVDVGVPVIAPEDELILKPVIRLEAEYVMPPPVAVTVKPLNADPCVAVAVSGLLVMTGVS
jgi:hypothetical protein